MYERPAGASSPAAETARKHRRRAVRIGLIGTDNSHAEDFLHMLNEAGRHPGFRVVGLWGAAADRTRTLAHRFGVPQVVAEPGDLVGKVDAAMVVDRHGGEHLSHARPFLDAGLPVFVDKPLACSIAAAEDILDCARRSGSIVTSASALRWQPDTEDLAAQILALGGPLAVVATGSFDPDSTYGGAFFYGIHPVELALQLSGAGIEDIAIDRCRRDAVVMSCRAGAVRVVVCLVRPAAGEEVSFHAQVVCPGGVLARQIRLAADYMAPVLDRFISMLRTRSAPLSDSELLAPVRLMAAADIALGKHAG
jgi:predicted dehydrogenase